MKNNYILLTFVITLCILTSCRTEPVAETNVSNRNRPPVAETLLKAEELFAQREDVTKLRDSLELLEGLRSPDARNFEIEWKFSKYSTFLGQRLTAEEERKAVFEEGLKAGQIASRLEPERPEGYFWSGANLGELSRDSPVSVGFKSIDDIREAMNKVIELQPAYQNGSAFDVLGQLEMQTRLFGGKSEKAVEYLEKGLGFGPTNSNVRLHLAQAYLSVDKDELAKKQLQYIIKMKPDPDYQLEHLPNLEAARKLLANRF